MMPGESVFFYAGIKRDVYCWTLSASGGMWSNWVCLLFLVLWSICFEVIKVTHPWALFIY
jgi:hypothetical protein